MRRHPSRETRQVVTESSSSHWDLAEMRPALVRYFRRKCGNPAEAEDLAQDVLLRVLSCAGWTSTEQARGYVFRAAVNRWRDRGRRVLVRGLNVAWDEAGLAAVDEEYSPERVLIGEQELGRALSALEELSERTRDIFILVRLEQMKHAQIAGMFGISVSAVEKHLSNAHAHLARRMSRPVKP